MIKHKWFLWTIVDSFMWHLVTTSSSLVAHFFIKTPIYVITSKNFSEILHKSLLIKKIRPFLPGFLFWIFQAIRHYFQHLKPFIVITSALLAHMSWNTASIKTKFLLFYAQSKIFSTFRHHLFLKIWFFNFQWLHVARVAKNYKIIKFIYS